MSSSSTLSLAALVCAIAGFILMIADSVLAMSNERLQADVQQRQQTINQFVDVSRVGNAMVQALTSVAASNKDPAIESLLHEYGFNVKSPAGTPPQSAPPPAAPRGSAPSGR